MKLVSIILPVYNGEKYLAISIESCLNQTYQNIELIIVNDCSTDASLAISYYYAALDNRIRVINNEKNRKLPASLNIGHNAAKGDFITWTSHDNFYERNALDILYNTISEKQADIVYSDFFLIDDLGNRVRKVEFIGIENIIFGNFVGCCFLYKKEVFLRNNGYNENFFLVEDYDFWLRAVLHSRYVQVKIALYNYRKHGESLTNLIATNDSKKETWKENINKMYTDFCKTVVFPADSKISELLCKSIDYQKIDFEWLVINDIEIQNFKKVLKQNQNFSDEKLIEKLFLEKTIEIMIKDTIYKNNFLKSMFILKKYTWFLDKNAFKTLVKYSFFK